MTDWKRSRLLGIVKFKCPRCHTGDMFFPGTLYNLSKFDKMHKSCAHCGQDFEKETGFYFGAMFVSYAIVTALFITAWIALTVLVEEVTMFMMVTAVTAIVVGLLPVIFRLSRVMWLSFFVGYKPDRILKKEAPVTD